MKLSALARTPEQVNLLSKEVEKRIDRLYIESDLFLEEEINPDCHFFIALPRIYRLSDEAYFEKLKPIIKKYYENGLLGGFLIRNLEELVIINKLIKLYDMVGLQLVADHTLYAFNDSSMDFYKEYGLKITLPLELKKSELMELKTTGSEMMVYGRVPLMVSAGCVQKTVKGCDKKSGFKTLVDRTDAEFLNYKSCIRCENILYNSLPTSLHKFSGSLEKLDLEFARLEFTNENRAQTQEVIACFYDSLIAGNQVEAGFRFTKGYFKRGVE